MRILVLGGTQFIGRHIVEEALRQGHQVSAFTRGVSPDPLPEQVERLRGNRDFGTAGLKSLQSGQWDVCIDVSGYTAVQVQASADLLQHRVEHCIYFSAVSVYGDPVDRPVLETHPLLPPADQSITEVNGDTYGPLKVSCEQAVQKVFGARCTILRPQVVVGPHDPSLRYTHWINRARMGGAMLAPGDGTDHLQVIDVRDVARFTLLAAARRLQGVFNLAGPRITWRQFVNMLDPQEHVWVSQEILQEANLTFMDLPLYRPEHGPRASLMDVSPELALQAGLTLTEPEVTLHDTRQWMEKIEFPLALAAEKEAELIQLQEQTSAPQASAPQVSE